MGPGESRTAARGVPRLGALARRVPLTCALGATLLLLAVLTGALWRPIAHGPIVAGLAAGPLALGAGRWWTPLTSIACEATPLLTALTLIALPIIVGWLERQRGTAVAARYFFLGHVGAVLGAALFLLLFSGLGWEWVDHLSGVAGMGAGAGLAACLAAAVNGLAQPWRRRGRLSLLFYAAVGVLFVGSWAALTQAVAILAVLLRGSGGPPRPPSIHERRVTCVVSLLALGAMQLIATVVPTRGPFGHTDLFGGAWGHALANLALVLLIALGMRRGYRLAWAGAIALVAVNVVTGALALLIARTGLARELAGADGAGEWAGAGGAWGTGGAWILGGGALGGGHGDGLEVTIANAALWSVFLAYLAIARGAFGVPLRRRLAALAGGPEQSVRALLQQEGGGSISWMATWPDNRHFFSASGRSMLAYQLHAGVAIVLGDPIGPPGERARVCGEFVAAVERAGLVPCFFVVGEESRAGLTDWRALPVAEDTLVDLPGLAFTGKRWNSVRTSLNRAGREGIEFRLTRLCLEPRRVQQQVRALSEHWLGERGLPEMGFTLGGVDEALDPAVRLAIAEDASGRIEGFLSWLPVYAPGGAIRGWTLDVMRRREGGFGPVVEFLIGRSARVFAEEGARVLSLSGAPLANLGQPGAGILDALVNGLGEALEPLYGFRSLQAFKRKFNPRYAQMYLLYRDEGDLARVGLGLGRAFLPGESLASLLRGAGVPRRFFDRRAARAAESAVAERLGA